MNKYSINFKDIFLLNSFISLFGLYPLSTKHNLVSICVVKEIYQLCSSSTCCATSTDFPDPLPPLFSIVHRLRLVFKGYMWRGPLEYVTYEFVLTSPAVSRMSVSSNFNSFRDGWQVAVQLLLCEVLPPWLVQYCSQHSWQFKASLIEVDFDYRLFFPFYFCEITKRKKISWEKSIQKSWYS